MDKDQATPKDHEQKTVSEYQQYLDILQQIAANQITKIDFSHLPERYVDQSFPSAFAKNNSVTSINLANCGLGYHTKASRSGISVESAYDSRQTFTDFLDNLATKNNLQTLNLSGNNFSNTNDFEKLKLIIQNHQVLEEFVLEDIKDLKAQLIIEMLDIIKKHPALKSLSLDLSSCSLELFVHRDKDISNRLKEIIDKNHFLATIKIKFGHSVFLEFDQTSWQLFLDSIGNNKFLKSCTLDLSSYENYSQKLKVEVMIDEVIKMIGKNTAPPHFGLIVNYELLRVLNESDRWIEILQSLEKNTSLLDFSITPKDKLDESLIPAIFNQKVQEILLRNKKLGQERLKNEQEKSTYLESFEQLIPLPFGDERLTPHLSLEGQREIIKTHNLHITSEKSKFKYNFSFSFEEYFTKYLNKVYGKNFLYSEADDNSINFIFQVAEDSSDDFLKLFESNEKLKPVCAKLKGGSAVRISFPLKFKKEIGVLLWQKLFDRDIDRFWSSPNVNQKLAPLSNNSITSDKAQPTTASTETTNTYTHS